MNAKQLQYALRLAQTRNFSQAADQLNLSQPALSKQILALEQEMGVRLFDRSTNPLTLTRAGEYFLQEAQELLFREEQLRRAMDGFAQGSRGRLVIGVSPFRSLYLMPPLISELKAHFPGLQVVLKEYVSAELHRNTIDGQYDFAVMNLPVDEAFLEVTPLAREQLVLAVPDAMAASLPVTPPGRDIPFPTVDLKDCKSLPFVVLSEAQELRRLFDKLCRDTGFHPNIDTEVVGITTAWAMVRAGIGATLLPLDFVQREYFSDGITFFTLRQPLASRQPVIIRRKGQPLSEYAAYAIGVLTR